MDAFPFFSIYFPVFCKPCHQIILFYRILFASFQSQYIAYLYTVMGSFHVSLLFPTSLFPFFNHYFSHSPFCSCLLLYFLIFLRFCHLISLLFSFYYISHILSKIILSPYWYRKFCSSFPLFPLISFPVFILLFCVLLTEIGSVRSLVYFQYLISCPLSFMTIFTSMLLAFRPFSPTNLFLLSISCFM